MLVRLSLCLIASTGGGPLGVLRATSAPVLVEVQQIRVADDRRVVVEQLNRVREPGLEVPRVGHLDVAPPTEALVVVDGRAPRVASRSSLRLSRAGALPAPGHLN